MRRTNALEAGCSFGCICVKPPAGQLLPQICGVSATYFLSAFRPALRRFTASSKVHGSPTRPLRWSVREPTMDHLVIPGEALASCMHACQPPHSFPSSPRSGPWNADVQPRCQADIVPICELVSPVEILGCLGRTYAIGLKSLLKLGCDPTLVLAACRRLQRTN
ncbi:hypothetical protein BU16DRAFT_276359 [Lophium mytilinum]|uniref:Uncharacterized protein n=1 Tax=Lophium mytilinum TaxID=390894 RepID=A0A6A6R4B2_9PEZI|nr:hypothetical protein BU16DRAFT_276359 [Lophium mytilinum]